MDNNHATVRNAQRPILTGYGRTQFKYCVDHDENEWEKVDYITDNGEGRGYAMYRGGRYIGVANLMVYDEIDFEADIIYGGPISKGWVTHFTGQYQPPSGDTISRYKTTKSLYRSSLSLSASPPQRIYHPPTNRRVQKFAVDNPTDQYGLDETEMCSQSPYAAGFNGTYHFPTTFNPRPDEGPHTLHV
ncbi:hypothetical protein GGR51DRAFT_576426 [Nemania sp. FL0031]|nr:hypothetical protein GGR51DRAFT_576426 [Nemania sp. FL0031]